MVDFPKEKRYFVIPIALIIAAILALAFAIRGTAPEGKREGLAKRSVMKVVGEVDIRNAIINVADTVGPAVVSISAERTQKYRVDPFPFRKEGSPFQDEFFDKFFEDFFRGAPQEFERKQAGLGSGVIIDEQGYILTNEHVITGADKVTVTLPDGRKFEAEIKGSDPRSDLAVLKIEARRLPVAELGDSSLVQTGEWVVAIGNPFGYLVDSPEPTVTVGVVSALQRSLPSQKSGYLDLIQTDAAINPGNSGGPLCNLEGKIIGISVAIFSTTGGYQGVGFAIPSNSAGAIIGDLKKGKEIAYGWMGVVIQDVTEDLAKYFGITDEKGALIAQIVKGSPADKAGLKAGDVVRKLNGKAIKSTKDLIVVISRIPVGRRSDVVVVRGKEEHTFTIEIGKMPSEEELARLKGVPAEKQEGQEIATVKWRGIEVAPITEAIARKFGIAADEEGVIVVNSMQGSPAYEATLRVGDVITSIDEKEVKTIEEFEKITNAIKGDILVYTDRGFTIVKEEE